MTDSIASFLNRLGIAESAPEWLTVIIGAALVLLLATLAYIVARHVIVRAIRRNLSKSQTSRDDILARNKVFERLSYLAPAFVIHALGPDAVAAYPGLAQAVSVASLIYITLVIIVFVNALLNAFLEIYNTYDAAREFSITAVVQVAKILVFVIGAVTIVSLLIDEPPDTLVTALLTAAAGATFVFKDSILGFVAGLQLTGNRMVSVGDWIDVPNYNAEGTVLEIGLTTVKVKNFDNTITTVPTYALVTDSFKNWRAMDESGGRRVKRAIHVDVSSIRFCDEAMLARFETMTLLSDYLAEKQEELESFNAGKVSGESPMTEGRHLTNIGTFRAYLRAYLNAHPNVRDDMTLLVRQLSPTPQGLPIELYFFTKTTVWAEYEDIQSDVFDHIFAAAHEFDLTIFQTPAGRDFKNWPAAQSPT